MRTQDDKGTSRRVGEPEGRVGGTEEAGEEAGWEVVTGRGHLTAGSFHSLHHST